MYTDYSERRSLNARQKNEAKGYSGSFATVLSNKQRFQRNWSVSINPVGVFHVRENNISIEKFEKEAQCVKV